MKSDHQLLLEKVHNENLKVQNENPTRYMKYLYYELFITENHVLSMRKHFQDRWCRGGAEGGDEVGDEKRRILADIRNMTCVVGARMVMRWVMTGGDEGGDEVGDERRKMLFPS